MLKFRVLAGAITHHSRAMHPLLPSRPLSPWIWGRGVAALLVMTSVLAASAGVATSLSFFAGGMALGLGVMVAKWIALRERAPSASAAALGLGLGVMAKWLVVGVLLLLAMRWPGAVPLWVLVGLVTSQVIQVLVVLTYKRQRVGNGE